MTQESIESQSVDATQAETATEGETATDGADNTTVSSQLTAGTPTRSRFGSRFAERFSELEKSMAAAQIATEAEKQAMDDRLTILETNALRTLEITTRAEASMSSLRADVTRAVDASETIRGAVESMIKKSNDTDQKMEALTGQVVAMSQQMIAFFDMWNDQPNAKRQAPPDDTPATDTVFPETTDNEAVARLPTTEMDTGSETQSTNSTDTTPTTNSTTTLQPPSQKRQRPTPDEPQYKDQDSSAGYSKC